MASSVTSGDSVNPDDQHYPSVLNQDDSYEDDGYSDHQYVQPSEEQDYKSKFVAYHQQNIKEDEDEDEDEDDQQYLRQESKTNIHNDNNSNTAVAYRDDQSSPSSPPIQSPAASASSSSPSSSPSPKRKRTKKKEKVVKPPPPKQNAEVKIKTQFASITAKRNEKNSREQNRSRYLMELIDNLKTILLASGQNLDKQNKSSILEAAATRLNSLEESVKDLSDKLSLTDYTPSDKDTAVKKSSAKTALAALARTMKKAPAPAKGGRPSKKTKVSAAPQKAAPPRPKRNAAVAVVENASASIQHALLQNYSPPPSLPTPAPAPAPKIKPKTQPKKAVPPPPAMSRAPPPQPPPLVSNSNSASNSSAYTYESSRFPSESYDGVSIPTPYPAKFVYNGKMLQVGVYPTPELAFKAVNDKRASLGLSPFIHLPPTSSSSTSSSSTSSSSTSSSLSSSSSSFSFKEQFQQLPRKNTAFEELSIAAAYADRTERERATMENFEEEKVEYEREKVEYEDESGERSGKRYRDYDDDDDGYDEDVNDGGDDDNDGDQFNYSNDNDDNDSGALMMLKGGDNSTEPAAQPPAYSHQGNFRI